MRGQIQKRGLITQKIDTQALQKYLDSKKLGLEPNLSLKIAMPVAGIGPRRIAFLVDEVIRPDIGEMQIIDEGCVLPEGLMPNEHHEQFLRDLSDVTRFAINRILLKSHWVCFGILGKGQNTCFIMIMYFDFLEIGVYKVLDPSNLSEN